VELTAVVEQTVALDVDLDSSSFNMNLRSCDVSGETLPGLLVCYSERSFWVWEVKRSAQEQLTTRRIANKSTSITFYVLLSSAIFFFGFVSFLSERITNSYPFFSISKFVLFLIHFDQFSDDCHVQLSDL
jgi:hypothetical protein